MDGYYEFPPHIEPKARDLVKSFLCADRSLRLGFARVSYLFIIHPLLIVSLFIFRTVRKKLRHTSGSVELIGEWF